MESGTPVRVCGWGNTVIVGSSMPAELHCVNTQIVSNSVANGSDSYGGGILHGMFTAGMPSSNSISGRKKTGGQKLMIFFLHQNFCIFYTKIFFTRKCFFYTNFFTTIFFTPKFLHSFCTKMFFYTNIFTPNFFSIFT